MRCAACFWPLAPAPLGGHYACGCRPPNTYRTLKGSYWYELAPEYPHTNEASGVTKAGQRYHFYGAVKL